VWCPWHHRRKPAESSECFPLGYRQASSKIWCCLCHFPRK
jgi:hypothetical protein